MSSLVASDTWIVRLVAVVAGGEMESVAHTETTPSLSFTFSRTGMDTSTANDGKV